MKQATEERQDAGHARTAKRADVPGGEAAPRLDKRTYLDREGGQCKVTIRDYGGGLCEAGWSFLSSLKPSKASRGKSGARAAHEDRAIRRARSNLRQKVLAAGADHLLTLTYRANVTDYRQTCDDLSAFVRAVRPNIPDWLYIAVPEQQKRGAWHWHLAVPGRQDVAILRACWLRVVGDGNIDVQRPRQASGNRRLAIVRYLGKYLAKGFKNGNRELNGHRFRASLGIQVPAESFELPTEARGQASAFIENLLRLRAGDLGFSWTHEDGLSGWACSWK